MANSNSDSGRQSQSPLSIRRGGAEYDNLNTDPVRTNAGEFNYDKNTVESLGPVEWDAPGSRPTAP